MNIGDDRTQSGDAAEIAKFDAQAARWWDPDGPAAALHAMQPARLDFIVDQIAAQFGRPSGARRFRGLRLLDVGCGPGLVSEPMARLGATVTGIDLSEPAIEAARAHAEAGALAIDYRVASAQAVAQRVGTRAEPAYDAALCFEVVEHAPDIPALLGAMRDCLAPGGLALVSTLNRTAKSFAMAIVGAEYLLRLLPVGTHDWRRFVKPDDLASMMAAAGLKVVDRTGFALDPLARAWRRDPSDLSVNYALAAERL